MAGILSSLHDALFGGKPNRWTQQQWDTFCESYAQMEKGVFSLTDFIPPTSLPGLASVIIKLSLKSLIKGGNRALFAGYVDLFNRQYTEGSNTRDLYETYSVKMTALGYSYEEVFVITLVLHDCLFPGVRRD